MSIFFNMTNYAPSPQKKILYAHYLNIMLWHSYDDIKFSNLLVFPYQYLKFNVIIYILYKTSYCDTSTISFHGKRFLPLHLWESLFVFPLLFLFFFFPLPLFPSSPSLQQLIPIAPLMQLCENQLQQPSLSSSWIVKLECL